MSMRHFALLLGLTTTGTATLLAPLPTRAASCETGDLFDFSSIQFIATRPIASNNCLRPPIMLRGLILVPKTWLIL